MCKPHNYEVQEIIGDMQILSQLTTERPDNRSFRKEYLVQCTVCGRQKQMREDKINDGVGIYHSACGFGWKNAGSDFYKKWNNMKQRIENPNDPNYASYGGRGLTHDYDYFIDFYNDMYKSYLEHCRIYGEADTTLERIDNDLGYVRGNLKWVTRDEQRNNTRNTVYFRYIDPNGRHGVDRNAAKFAKHHNLPDSAIRYHLNTGAGYYDDWYFEKISKYEYILENLIRGKIARLYAIPVDRLIRIAKAELSIDTSDKDQHAIVEEIIKQWVKRKLDE